MGVADDIFTRAEQLETQGKFASAAEEYSQLAEMYPEKQVFRLLAADAWARAGDLSSAIEESKRATELAPEYHLAFRSLGRYFLDADNRAEAEPALRRSVSITPTATAHIYLARLHLRNKDVRQAEQEAQNALALAPDMDEAHYTLGIILAEAGRRSEAIDSIKEAIKISPDYALAKDALKKIVG